MNKEKTAHIMRSFRWLNLAQFLGALNDNLFKFFSIFILINLWGQEADARITSLIGALFALPFLMFVTLAGIFADRWSKSAITVQMKFLEIVVMGVGLLSFWLKSPWGVLATSFLMSMQSSLFSPAKYGLIPELVPPDKIPIANGHIQALTYIAVICGTILAPLVYRFAPQTPAVWGGVCVLVAVLGWIASLLIRRTPAAGNRRPVSLNPVGEIWRTIRANRSDRYIIVAMLAAGFFLLVGAYVQLNIIPYGREALELSKEKAALLFLFAALGIGAGSWLAGRLSPRHAELGLVPIGAALVAISCGGLYAFPSVFHLGVARYAAAVWLFLLGMGGGLFLVPLEALVQYRSPPDRLGQNLAACSWIGWVGVIAAAGLLAFHSEVLNFNAAEGFLPLALLTLILLTATIFYLPELFLQFLAMMLIGIRSKIRVFGVRNVPMNGSSLLICKAEHWLDTLLILRTQQRPTRYLMAPQMMEGKKSLFFAWLFRWMGITPIPRGDEEEGKASFLRKIDQAKADGDLIALCSNDAQDFTRIWREWGDLPVLTVLIQRTWKHLGRLERSNHETCLPAQLEIAYGKPLADLPNEAAMQDSMRELSCRILRERAHAHRNLGEEFIRTARQNWKKPALADATGRRLTFGQAAVASCLFARIFEEKLAPDERAVAVLLPPSRGAALANMALILAGRTVVNLDAEMSISVLESRWRDQHIHVLITSGLWVENLGWSDLLKDAGIRVLDFKETIGGVPLSAKLRAFWRARIQKSRVFRPDDFSMSASATVIFPQDTGLPSQGMRLSHLNLLASVVSLRVAFQPEKGDCLISALSYSDSVGFVAGFLYPLLCGFSVAFHAQGSDPAKVLDLIKRNKGTVLLAYPALAQGVGRHAEKESACAMVKKILISEDELSAKMFGEARRDAMVEIWEIHGARDGLPIFAARSEHGNGSVELQLLPGINAHIVKPDDADSPALHGEEGVLQICGPGVSSDTGTVEKAILGGCHNTGWLACWKGAGRLQLRGRVASSFRPNSGNGLSP